MLNSGRLNTKCLTKVLFYKYLYASFKFFICTKENPVKSCVCIKNRYATEKTSILHSPAYGVYFYKIQSRENSQVSRILFKQDNKKKGTLLWSSRGKQGVLAQGLALIGSLGDLASLNFLSVEHRDRTGNPQQFLQCPRSLSCLTGQTDRQQITSIYDSSKWGC